MRLGKEPWSDSVGWGGWGLPQTVGAQIFGRPMFHRVIDTVTRECQLSAKAVLGAGAGPAHAGSALFTEDRLRRKVQNLSAQVL